MFTKQTFNDPYKLVEQLFTPLSKIIPEKLKAEKRTPLYGFLYGGFQTTIESAFFGQVINYSFITKQQNKPFTWKPSVVYKTLPKNLNNLIPYYTTTRALQAGYPQTKNRNWMIRTLTPTCVLPYEHALSFVTNKMNPSIPRPICSVYHNIVPFTFMEWIYQASTVVKPKVNSTFNKVLSNGWSQLATAALCNAFGYFMNHPAYVVNVYMKQHPKDGVIKAVRSIAQSNGWKGFYAGAIHRCTRAAHSAVVTSLAGVAFDTLFLKKNEDDKKKKQKKQASKKWFTFKF